MQSITTNHKHSAHLPLPRETVGLTDSIRLEDAANLAGLSSRFLRSLARKGKFQLRAKGKFQYVRWDELKSLVTAMRLLPPLLTSEMLDDEDPPYSLMLSTIPGERKDRSEFQVNRIELGHCIDWMNRMPTDFVQTVVTSPPYWGVRRYLGNQTVTWADGMKVPLGIEQDPDDYVRHSLEVLLHLKHVLRQDGTVWWNIGDTYHTRAVIRESTVERLDAFEGRRSDRWKDYPFKRYSSRHRYLKDKDLALVPFKVAMGAQSIGFWVRSVVTWAKENTMPEPIKDRPTTAHEYVLMFTKSRFYYYDHDASKEGARTEAIVRYKERSVTIDRRNLRTVWSLPVSVNHGNHTAAFPLELPARCIAISSKRGDLVFDPFVGSGTALIAAYRAARKFFGVDISKEYVELARKRLESEQKTEQSSKTDLSAFLS